MDGQVLRSECERLLVGTDLRQLALHIPCLTRAERCRITYLDKQGNRGTASSQLLDTLERLNAWGHLHEALSKIGVSQSDKGSHLPRVSDELLRHGPITKIYHSYHIKMKASHVGNLNIGSTTIFAEEASTGCSFPHNERGCDTEEVEITVEGQDEIPANPAEHAHISPQDPVTATSRTCTDDIEICRDSEEDADDTCQSSFVRRINKHPSPTKHQQELASTALNRNNCVIFVPHRADSVPVAMLIIRKYIGDHRPTTSLGSRVSKVLYLVPNNGSLHMAYSAFKSYLSPQWCVGVRSKGTMNANDVILNDIIVATAETLDNCLISLRSFALLIFEGCLHALTKHAYNTVLRKYLHERSTTKDINCPKVVGLCAQVKPKDKSDIPSLRNEILDLCAILTAEKIVAIQRQSEASERMAKTPTRHAKIISPGYEKRDCAGTILDMMKELEKWIHINEDPAFGIAVKGTRAYFDLLQDLRKAHNCHPVFAGYIYCLQVCNEALFLLKGVSAEAAIARLVDFIDQQKQKGQLSDMLLVSSEFSDQLAHLQGCLQTGTEETMTQDLLQKLKGRLLGQNHYCVQRGKLFAAILFFNNVDHARLLKEWMEADLILRSFRPEVLHCRQKTTMFQTRTYMDSSSVLANYHRGRHQILCCTTPWQNLDVDFCSMMVIFEHDMKEITLVMSRDDSDNETMCTAGSLTSKEGKEMNVLAEEKLAVAIEEIQRMPADVFQTSINKKQHRIISDYREEELMNSSDESVA